MSNGTIANGGSFTNVCQGSVTSVSGNAPTTSPCATPTMTTNSSQTFDVTNPTINGTSDANAAIKLTEGNMTIGQTTADSTGNWTITVTPLTPGTHTLTAEAYGTGGDSGSASTQVTISRWSYRHDHHQYLHSPRRQRPFRPNPLRLPPRVPRPRPCAAALRLALPPPRRQQPCILHFDLLLSRPRRVDARRSGGRHHRVIRTLRQRNPAS